LLNSYLLEPVLYTAGHVVYLHRATVCFKIPYMCVCVCVPGVHMFHGYHQSCALQAWHSAKANAITTYI